MHNLSKAANKATLAAIGRGGRNAKSIIQAVYQFVHCVKNHRKLLASLKEISVICKEVISVALPADSRWFSISAAMLLMFHPKTSAACMSFLEVLWKHAKPPPPTVALQWSAT